MATVTKRPWTYKGVTKEAWAVRYLDPATGKRPSKQFDTKKEADAFKRKVEREIEDGVHTIDAEAMTVAAVADAFLVYSEERYRSGTIGKSRFDRFRCVTNRYVKPHFKAARFRDMKLTDVEAFYASMTAAGLAPITSRENVIVLRMMERYARRRGMLKTQPVTDALHEIKGTARNRVRTFTADEVTQLLATADTRQRAGKARPHAMMRCMVNVAAFCGLRMGEIMGLTLDNLDLEKRVIHVRHSLTQWDLLKGPKTSSGVRDVPLPQHVVTMLSDWITTYYVEEKRGLIFRTMFGGMINAQNYMATFHALLKRAGIYVADNPFRFHALRHFTASWMQHNGLPMADIAKLLGHSSFDVTLQVYVHSVVAPHMQHDLIERMVTQMPALADARVTQSPGNGGLLRAK